MLRLSASICCLTLPPDCQPGYGGVSCSSLCGGEGENATYGGPGRQMLLGGAETPCTQCSANGKTVTFSYLW